MVFILCEHLRTSQKKNWKLIRVRTLETQNMVVRFLIRKLKFFLIFSRGQESFFFGIIASREKNDY